MIAQQFLKQSKAKCFRPRFQWAAFNENCSIYKMLSIDELLFFLTKNRSNTKIVILVSCVFSSKGLILS